MIGKLTGRVDFVAADHVILDVGGVGYLVHCPSSTLAWMTVGATASLAVETKVSEDAIRLYGFLSADEREWFRLLQQVQGVGARVALSVLSAVKVPELERAIVLGDKAVVGRAQGVGPKLAQRIVAELKDKMPSLAPAIRPGAGLAPVATLPEGLAARDAVSALTNLGYAHGEAAAAISAAIGKAGREARPEELIRLGLKELAHG